MIISIDVLSMRYRLLPYWYLQFYLANQLGTAVTRSMVFEFPALASTLGTMDTQFMVGPAPIHQEFGPLGTHTGCALIRCAGPVQAPGGTETSV